MREISKNGGWMGENESFFAKNFFWANQCYKKREIGVFKPRTRIFRESFLFLYHSFKEHIKSLVRKRSIYFLFNLFIFMFIYLGLALKRLSLHLLLLALITKAFFSVAFLSLLSAPFSLYKIMRSSFIGMW